MRLGQENCDCGAQWVCRGAQRMFWGARECFAGARGYSGAREDVLGRRGCSGGARECGAGTESTCGRERICHVNRKRWLGHKRMLRGHREHLRAREDMPHEQKTLAGARGNLLICLKVLDYADCTSDFAGWQNICRKLNCTLCK